MDKTVKKPWSYEIPVKPDFGKQCVATAPSSAAYSRSRRPEQCRRDAHFAVGDQPFCSQHAGAEILDMIKAGKAVVVAVKQ